MAEGKIKIYRRQEKTVSGRREELPPLMHHEPWCSVGSLYGQELYKALEIRLNNTIVFEVRYCRKIKEMRHRLKEFYVEYDGENYDIFAIDFRKNERQYVLLKANRTE